MPHKWLREGLKEEKDALSHYKKLGDAHIPHDAGIPHSFKNERRSTAEEAGIVNAREEG